MKPRFFVTSIIIISCTLREKCPHSECFWSVISSIRIEYGPEKLRIREYGHFSRSYIFPEDFIKSHQVVQKRWKFFSSIWTNFFFFWGGGGDFLTFPCHKKLIMPAYNRWCSSFFYLFWSLTYYRGCYQLQKILLILKTISSWSMMGWGRRSKWRPPPSP